MTTMTLRYYVSATILVLVGLIVLVVLPTDENNHAFRLKQNFQHLRRFRKKVAVTTKGLSSHSQQQQASINNNNDNDDTNDEIAALRLRLQPRELQFDYTDDITTGQKKTARPHQLLHLHHMKTGGTSTDDILQCALRRMHSDQTVVVPYQNIHECSHSRYTQCRDGRNPSCNNQCHGAAVMSYCAPLCDLPAFGWTEENKQQEQDEGQEDGSTATTTMQDALDQETTTTNTMIDKVTVLRHPVDRVWSMYRFQTKRCYGCRNLTQIYAEINDGTSKLESLCQAQLLNHQTHNLMHQRRSATQLNQDAVDEAIYNLQTTFTLVGLTEDMVNTAQMLGMVFPWLNETVTGNDNDSTCPLHHRNSSPKNNRCGPHDTHLNLPEHPPDDATRQAIEEHNQLDMQLYQAGVQQFELQKVALGIE